MANKTEYRITSAWQDGSNLVVEVGKGIPVKFVIDKGTLGELVKSLHELGFHVYETGTDR